MTYTGPERRNDPNRWLRLALIVWASAVTVVVIYVAQENRTRSAEGRQAKLALCIFKHDLTRRADATEQFLVDHPAGFAGITAAQLKAELETERRTIESLMSLNCEDGT